MLGICGTMEFPKASISCAGLSVPDASQAESPNPGEQINYLPHNRSITEPIISPAPLASNHPTPNATRIPDKKPKINAPNMAADL